MARKRNPKRDEAFEMWKKHNGEITNREIAKQLDVPERTVSSWKSRDKWNAVLQKNNRSIASEKRSTSDKNEAPKKKPRYRPGSRKGVGNPNPENKFTKRNSAAVKHGFYRKYLPEETKEIIESMEGQTPADLIYSQIEIQFAAIIRAQKIMFVESKDEMIKEIKKRKESLDSDETEYEFQFAWDRHATYLNAQSRAMAELRNLIKQFNELAHEDDIRRLQIEQMKASIAKTEAEIENLQGDKDSDSAEDWVNAIKEVAEKRKQKQVKRNE